MDKERKVKFMVTAVLEMLDNLGSGRADSVRSRPVNCTTRKVGGYVRTFCY